MSQSVSLAGNAGRLTRCCCSQRSAIGVTRESFEILRQPSKNHRLARPFSTTIVNYWPQSTVSSTVLAAEIQTPVTYYSYFPVTLPNGPPPNSPFIIDVPPLRREFLRLQAQVHPDKQPANRRSVAESQSARLNEAFRTLADPLQRAQYLLRLRGIDVTGDETAKADDLSLLAEVMEAREEIEEAGSEEELVAMRERNKARLASCVKALDESFANEDVERAKAEVVKLRYWTNIQTALDDWEKGKPPMASH